MTTSCEHRLVQVYSVNGITTHQKASSSSLSARRSGGMLHRNRSAREQAFRARGSSHFCRSVRLWPRNPAGQADAYKGAKELRGMSFSRLLSRWLVPSSAIYQMARDDRSVHQSEIIQLGKLRSARHICPSPLAYWPEWTDGAGNVSVGHGRMPGRIYNRASGQCPRIRTRQLHLGTAKDPKPQSSRTPPHFLEQRNLVCWRMGRTNRDSILYTNAAHQTGVERRAGIDRATPKISQSLPQFVQARRIINGTDRAEMIAGYALHIQSSIIAGRWA